MARKKAQTGLSVPATRAVGVSQLLNEAQRVSASGHLRYAKVLWECHSEDIDGTYAQLMFALKLFMTVPEVRIPPRAVDTDPALARARSRLHPPSRRKTCTRTAS
jgi:hypothetical protein